MIDKIELLTDERALRAEFYSLSRNGGALKRPSVQKGFGKCFDFRLAGIDLRIHWPVWKNHRLKVEVLDAGSLNRQEILADIEKLFQCDALDLDLTRVDLAADVKDFNVNWFRQHAFIERKRNTKDRFERVRVDAEFTDDQFQTYWIGKRPNIYRFYDKGLELWSRFRRRAGADGSPDAFRDTYGFDRKDVLTRVERQIGGNAVPKELESLGGLFENAICTNPFAKIHFVEAITPPSLEGIPPAKYMDALGLHYLLNVQGYSIQQIKKEFNKRGRRGKEILDRLLPVLSDEGRPHPDLFRLYRDSLVPQLEAHPNSKIDATKARSEEIVFPNNR